mmetsp:Transcript_9722/g.16898  ORF Transcript_9722/g.16898 Transcript_9722/m.16898 type:complete len:263 (+) Transcript_9722:276-1064(+)
METEQEALRQLRELSLKLGAGTLHRDDDAYLLLFLRWAKLDVPKALKRMQNTEKWLKDNSALLGDVSTLTASQFRSFYGAGFLSCPDVLTKDGATVVIFRPKKLTAECLPDPSILLKWSIYTLYRAVHDEQLQQYGQLIIETFQGMSFMDAMRLGNRTIPSHIMKANMHFMNSCAPFRVNGIWLFHQSTAMSILLAIVRPFMSKKMKKRIRAFGDDYHVLHQVVDATKLPADFGGTARDDGCWPWFDRLAQQEEQERANASQ